jgi:hypothetical protein
MWNTISGWKLTSWCFDEDELEACAEEEDRNTVVEVVVDLEVVVERSV